MASYDSPRLKMVVVGDGAVGKSCFLITWSSGSFPSEYVPTVFDNYAMDKFVEGHGNVILAVFDTAGQEDYDRLRPLAYPETDVILMCYDISNRSSFENIKSKWLPEVRHYIPDAHVVLLALKSDLKDTARSIVTYDEGYQLAKEEVLSGFHEVSSLRQQGIEEAMHTAIINGLSDKKKKKRFNLFKRKKSSKSSEPTIPPPPVMPENTRAPWINITSSSLASDWSKLINHTQFSDVIIHLSNKRYHGHRYVLCTASDVMRRLLGVPLSQFKPSESLSEYKCPQWSLKRLKELTFDTINNGQVEGFVSIVAENQSSSNPLPTVHITLDEQLFTETALKRCLEFLYTGIITVDKTSEELDETIKAAGLLNLPELIMICKNAQSEQEFLNPSIGTWLNDCNSFVAKDLFFNKTFLSDVEFLVEGVAIPAHKIVLATRCDVLEAMLTGGFSETNTHQIEIPEVSSDTFLAMLEYLYTDHSPIEETDSIGIMILANQYVQPRLSTLCQLYVTKQVDKACAKSIAEADINIIDLLLLSQLHNAGQLSGWCLHFISSNYLVFENKDQFKQLETENKEYIEKHRWPPVSYLEAMEEYQRQYGSDEEISKGKRKREKCSVM